VVECITETGGEICFVPNGSPYWRDRPNGLNIAVARVVESGLRSSIQYGRRQDELIFDRRLVRTECRPLRSRSSFGIFRNRRDHRQWVRENGTWRCLSLARIAMIEEADTKATYAACVLGFARLRQQERVPGVVSALRRIDSALCAAMAVDALGRARVARRDAALSLHLAGTRWRTPPRREGARIRYDNRADSATREGSRSA